jgi:predicted metalloprotease with PDZ domain
MNKLILFLVCTFVFLSVFAQQIRYNFSAPNAIHHEAEISVTASGLPSAKPVFFRMSRSSPGRYATHEFGKNIYNVKAFDEAGRILRVEKTEPDVYKVSGHKGTIKVSYTLFGNHADGTYVGIDKNNFHLNMPATFMWVKGLEKAPIVIHFMVPDTEWKVATQLKPTTIAYTFTAPNLQYFMDAPTKVAKLHIREWTVTNPGNKNYTMRLALDADGSEATVDSFTAKLKKVVEAGKQVYGEFPAFDYGSYTFISSINPYVKGDGMEHRNSTMITIPSQFDGSNQLLGVFAHEFFHAWNVERIRPKSLEPFNFEKANMSEALWLAEGFTHYYGDVLMVRAGLLSQDEFIREMAKLVNTKVTTQGAQNYSPIENSQRAVFVDAGVSIDQNNYSNMFTSYYPYGGAIALALDLELRSRFNKSLDIYMQELWKTHGKTEIPYTIKDLEIALAKVSTNKIYAADFFRKYIYGHEPIDYNKLFTAANLKVDTDNGVQPWIGEVVLNPVKNGLLLLRGTVKNSPLYEAGVDINDIILELDGNKVDQRKEVENILNDHKAGDKIFIKYLHQDKLVETYIVLKQNPSLKIVEGNTPGKSSEAFRISWMSNAK